MENYTQAWTEFEIHSLAYSLLRKHLYPNFLVRGDFKFDTHRVDVAIFKANKGKPPTLKIILEIKQSDHDEGTDSVRNFAKSLDVPYILIAGLKEAYKVVDKVQEHLFK